MSVHQGFNYSDFTYAQLAFHIVDSQSLRWFCRIGIAEEGFKKSAPNRNIMVVSDRTWEMINRDILGYAKQEGIEGLYWAKKLQPPTR